MKGAMQGRVEAVRDAVSLAPAATAPAWLPTLQAINEILSTISLVLAIGLALWRAWRWMQDERPRGD